MSFLIKYKKLSAQEKKLFWKAWFWLFVARLNTTFLPSKKYLKKLGRDKTLTSENNMPEHEEYVRILKKSIRRAVKYTPFKTKCLQQAYAGKIILNKANIPSTVYFGLAKDKNNKLIAHAWLRTGNIIVTGEKEKSKFTVVQYIS
ncbi:MAG: lasso peptide biosynthesis B2 protein [Marinilabiliales bacterium]